MSKKTWISLILLCTVVLILTACGTQKDAPTEEEGDAIGEIKFAEKTANGLCKFFVDYFVS